MSEIVRGANDGYTEMKGVAGLSTGICNVLMFNAYMHIKFKLRFRLKCPLCNFWGSVDRNAT